MLKQWEEFDEVMNEYAETKESLDHTVKIVALLSQLQLQLTPEQWTLLMELESAMTLAESDHAWWMYQKGAVDSMLMPITAKVEVSLRV
jgi:hypothetical protein